MALRIKNGGIEGALLRIVKESGDKLSEAEEAHLAYLEGLPKNVDVYIDENHRQIPSRDVTDELLSKMKIRKKEIWKS